MSSTHPPERKPNREASGRSVVIVTDDPLYGQLLEYGLTARGIACRVERMGQGARKSIERHRPHAVIVDTFLAVIECFKLLHWLRDESSLEVPVLVLSCSENRSFTVEALVAGAHDVAVKPVTFPEVLDRLLRIWDLPGLPEGGPGEARKGRVP